MGTVKGIKTKLLVVLIVFMIVFSNCGFTLSAIATSDGFQVITNGFFKKDEIAFEAYFEDENGNQTSEITKDVNQKVRLILDILPQVDGYLKSANLKAVSEDSSDVNFKITGISYYQEQEENTSLDASQTVSTEINNGESNEVVEPAEEPVEETVPSDTTTQVEETQEETSTDLNTVAENTINENVVEDGLNADTMVSTTALSGTSNTTNESVVDEVSNVVENTVENTLVEEVPENVVGESSINNETENTNTTEEITNEVVNETTNEVVSEEATNEIPTEEVSEEQVQENQEDILVDEEKIIEEKTEEATQEVDLTYDMKLISDNEIEFRNIIKDTKVVLELEYKMGEKLNVEDLMKNIHLQLSGTYINSDLEEVQVAKEAIVTLGWKYTKDIELTSEYTKFSPFEVGDIKGTIVENKISVKREITDEKYLPIKNTTLEVGVPEVNGKKPIEINVICEKLLATRGEDTGYTTFVKDNWSYDAGEGKILISVENSELVYTSGMDEYVIIYRYEDKIDAENSDLSKKVKLTIEEYSAENNIITKQINETQNIKVDLGELITYSISTTEDTINKAKVYANYNNESAVYETEYSNQVNVNILTSDILEELKINCNEEVYKDVNGFEFEAEGIEYKKVKFSFLEITNLLVNGGEIVITNEAGELLYTLNKDVINTEEDCQVNLNGQTGIIIYARNIAKNGSLNFEVVKAIKKCNYDKSAFKNFTSIESRISAEVKYQKIEERLSLQKIGATKDFEESTTFATLSVNKESLSTTKSNENVEFKIELNNDKQNSDLYINPAFEIVFPKHVKEVTIQSAHVLYENGLRIGRIDTYSENDIQKIRIELEGIQQTFSESQITNGTNVVVNANIKVDEYTPKKEDQIKLYYCNEGVATYQAQTKWSISKTIPNNILKTTNGFDVAIIKYQAPSGLIAINGIVNYDGNLSEIKSVKQGEVKKQIDINSTSKIMTMELLALNNTDNKCTDIVLLGRIPFAGVKDVITNENLGTTTNTVMKDLIKQDIQNTNTVDIYYSANADATKELDNIGNGWTKEVTDISQVKSFLIVVKGSMEAGQVLRYTYDFEVPANLPYETNIEGSFGAFYNNNTDVAVVYESSVADTVGLTTEAGPKLEAILTADINENEKVQSNRRIKYTVKISNSGSVDANDVVVKCNIPSYTNYVERDSRTSVGDYGYITTPKSEIQIPVGTVPAGEEKEVSYYLMTTNKPTLDQYAQKDETGYYIITGYEDKEVQREEIVGYEPVYDEEGEFIREDEIKEIITEIEKIPIKEYITEVPDIYIKNKVTVSTSLLAKEIESNEITHELVQANFKSEIRVDYDRLLQAGMATEFILLLTNTSGKDLNNVEAYLNIEDIYEFKSGNVDNRNDIEIKEDNGKVYFYIGEMKNNEVVTLEAYLIAKSIEEYTKTVDCYFEMVADDIKSEKSTIVSQSISKGYLTASDMTLNFPEAIQENETFTVSTLITNISTADSKNARLEIKVPEELSILGVEVSNGSKLSVSEENGSNFASLPLIYAQQSITVDIKLKAKNMPGTEDTTAVIERIIHSDEQEDFFIENKEVKIKNNEKTDEEKEEERVNNLKEEDKQNQINDNTNNSNDIDNPSNDNNSNTDIDNSTTNNNSHTNINNSTVDNNSNTNDKSVNISQSGTTTTTQTSSPKYKISGLAWLDENKDGIRDDSESGIGGIKVYLLTSNNSMIKSTITANDGSYNFSEIENGRYVIAVSYDEEQYKATSYGKDSTSNDRNSYIMENNSEGISAITNEINVKDINVENVNIGLQNREIFDIKVNKYISKITVENGKYNEVYDFDNLDLAKVEIPAKRINNAKVTLEYVIAIENIGDIEGYAENIVDYIDSDLEFDESQNTDWVKGTDGYIYTKSFSQTALQPGDKKEIKLVLTKTMNEDNTGTLSNKIALLSAFSQSEAIENANNNTSVQNTLILISTGYTTQILIAIIIIMLIVIILYNGNFISKNYYKNKIKLKFKSKKVYK